MNIKIDSELEEMAQQEIEEEMKQEEWPDLIPINCFDNLPGFPVQFLPSPGREMIETVASVNQVDMGMPGSIYLAVLSTCMSKKGVVDLITHTEPLNIYVCSIADVGERKSKTIHLMTSPVYEYQKEKEVALKDSITTAYNSRRIKEQRLAYLQNKAAKIDNEIERIKLQCEASELSIEIENNPLPSAPIIIVDDITSEAIATIMAPHDEKLSVISAEGGIFGIMAGRYNERGGANIDIYLKAHAGDPYSSHRIGRKKETMLNPALTMCLTVQPGVIQEIGNNHQFRGKGLLARFMYSVNKAKAGSRIRQQKTMPTDLLIEYNEFIKNLIAMPGEQIILKLSSEAQAIWDEFYNDIETEMQPGRSLETLKDWGSKLSGAVARIAGLLHFAEYGSNATNKTISAGTVGASCAIGAYFKEHALAVFGFMKDDPKIEAAKKILDYLMNHKPDTFKGRDILLNKNAFKTMDDVNMGLKILIERSYIRDRSSHYAGVGRPESTIYEVNKKIYTL